MNKTLLQLVIISTITTMPLMATAQTKMDLIKQASKQVGEIVPKKLKALLDDEEDVIVLDVREVKQRAEGSIPFDDMNAENFYAITRGNLEWEIGKKITDKDALIVTYCRRGGRGALAAEVLRKMGYKNATTLKGGLKGWAAAGYPVQTGLGNVVLKKVEK